MQENSITTASRFLSQIRKKNVVYITVKNKDYIRTSQIRHILEENSAFFRIYSSEKSNPVSRALDLRRRVSFADISDADVVIIGFLPQLLLSSVKRKKSANAEDRCGKQVLIAEMFLSMYDTVISDRHLFADGGLIARLMNRLDKETLEAADLVVTDTKANADYLSHLYEVDRGKFETLYLEADKEIYGAAEETGEVDLISQEKELGLGNTDTNILYFGSGLPLQGTGIVLEAFDMIAGEASNITCTYIGSTKEIPGRILDKARTNPYIEFIPWLPQNLLAKKIAKADLCIAGHFNPDIGKADRTIPGKAYIYEAMNKKMILGDTTANHELFVEDDRHFFVRRGNAGELVETIRRALSAN